MAVLGKVGARNWSGDEKIAAPVSGVSLCHLADRCVKLGDGLLDHLLDRLDLVDAAADLARERNRRLHVAAEIEIERVAEFAHYIGRRLLLDARRFLGAERA